MGITDGKYSLSLCKLLHLQAEVDKQDDLPDFSKTDAHRSTEAQKAETQADSPTDPESLPGKGMFTEVLMFGGLSLDCPRRWHAVSSHHCARVAQRELIDISFILQCFACML